MIKVYDGTPTHAGTSICRRCRNAQIITASRSGQSVQYCHSQGTPIVVGFDVGDCSMFDNKSTPSLWQLEKVAWRFNVDDKRRIAGFLTPKEYFEKFPDGD